MKNRVGRVGRSQRRLIVDHQIDSRAAAGHILRTFATLETVAVDAR